MLDRVLLSYGFNSYRLRVNKLELELVAACHTAFFPFFSPFFFVSSEVPSLRLRILHPTPLCVASRYSHNTNQRSLSHKRGMVILMVLSAHVVHPHESAVPLRSMYVFVN